MPTGPVIPIQASAVCLLDQWYQYKPLCCMPIGPVIPIQASLLHAYWTSDTNTGLSAACLLDQRYQHKLLCCVPIRPVILTNTSLTNTSLSAACVPIRPVILTNTSLSAACQCKARVADTLEAAHHILTSAIGTHACSAALVIICEGSIKQHQLWCI